MPLPKIKVFPILDIFAGLAIAIGAVYLTASVAEHKAKAAAPSPEWNGGVHYFKPSECDAYNSQCRVTSAGQAALTYLARHPEERVVGMTAVPSGAGSNNYFDGLLVLTELR